MFHKKWPRNGAIIFAEALLAFRGHQKPGHVITKSNDTAVVFFITRTPFGTCARLVLARLILARLILARLVLARHRGLRLPVTGSLLPGPLLPGLFLAGIILSRLLLFCLLLARLSGARSIWAALRSALIVLSRQSRFRA